MASLVAEVTWLGSLLTELKIPQTKTPEIWCDNLSTVLMAANPVLHARTKHVELDLYFVCDKVARKQIEVKHVPAKDQLADVLTKPLSNSNFPVLRSKLNVVDYTTLSLREAIRE